MLTRLGIAILVFMMVQPVLFGLAAVIILATSLEGAAMTLLPWFIGGTIWVSAPFSWWLAPRLRARYWRRDKAGESLGDKTIEALS